MKTSPGVLGLLIVVCALAAGQSKVVAVPSQSNTPRLQFPRISGLGDREAERHANEILASREKADKQNLKDCSEEFPDTRSKDDNDSETARVSYLSNMFLSIDVRVSLESCGVAPQEGLPEPITLDLRSGSEIDWKTFFSPGFYTVTDFGKIEDTPPAPDKLTKLYLAGFKNDPLYKDGADCYEILAARGYDFLLWFDRKRGALVAIPDLPHGSQYCADEIAIPLRDVLQFVVDEKAARDLDYSHPAKVKAKYGGSSLRSE